MKNIVPALINSVILSRHIAEVGTDVKDQDAPEDLFDGDWDGFLRVA